MTAQPSTQLQRVETGGGPPVIAAGQSIQLRTFDDVHRLGETLARSGYFKDTRDAAQAVVKILYGAEIGLGPVQAMMGVHIIEGKPAPGAALVAALIKRSGKYTYRVRRWDATGCELEFFERVEGKWESLGPASFDEADAKRASLLGRGPWKSFPKAMYFARAVTVGGRTYTPDIFGGAVYDPEEFGGEPQLEAPAADPTQRVREMDFPGKALWTGPVEPAEAVVVEAEVVDEQTGEVLQDADPLDELGRKVYQGAWAAKREVLADAVGAPSYAQLTPDRRAALLARLQDRVEGMSQQAQAFLDAAWDDYKAGNVTQGEVKRQLDALVEGWPEGAAKAARRHVLDSLASADVVG